MRLAGFGSYHVGGRFVTVAGRPRQPLPVTSSTVVEHDPNGDYAIESAYVQWFEPESRRHPTPIVLVHGGGLSGVTWETTPDGRPGWLNRFVDAGFAVNVVDLVERGRAGWCALPEVWSGAPVMRTLQEAWTLFRFGRPEDFEARRPFDGQRFPIRALEAFARQFVPRWTTNGDASRDALLQVVERIGPCTLVCHSQGGEPAFDVAARRPDLVRAIVALEPSGGFHAVEALHTTPVMIMLGDHLDASALWAAQARRIEGFALALRQAGAPVRLDVLPEHGIRGNSHMLMMDDNSAMLADRVVSWL